MAEKSISIGPIQDAYVYDDDDEYRDDDGNPTGVKHHGIKTDGKIVTTHVPTAPGEVLRIDDLGSGVVQEVIWGDSAGNAKVRLRWDETENRFEIDFMGGDSNWYTVVKWPKPTWVP